MPWLNGNGRFVKNPKKDLTNFMGRVYLKGIRPLSCQDPGSDRSSGFHGMIFSGRGDTKKKNEEC